MIQKTIPDGKGGHRELGVHEMDYWEGPYRYEPYPKAVYRQAQPGEQPKMQIVTREQHEKLGPGWYGSPEAAREAFDALERDIAKAAAERIYADERMSEPARREALRYDRQTDTMVPVIPEQPKKRRPGRPKKVKTDEPVTV